MSLNVPSSAMQNHQLTREQLMLNLRQHVQDELGRKTVGLLKTPSRSELETMIVETISEAAESLPEITDQDKEDITEYVINDFLNYGPLQPYLEDESISEIMVNSAHDVYVERSGKLYRVESKVFDNDEQVQHIIDRIGAPLNKQCTAQSPYMDARLPDGSRVNAVIPPISRFGSSITIRKFPKHRMGPRDLLGVGTCNATMMNFLQAAVIGRCNILVSGGTGSGKTTFLNVLSGFIPDDQRIITVEDTAELQLKQDHWVSLESRSSNTEGSGAVSIHDLIVNTLRMRPDRIIVGECRSTETIEMLQAMNTGHDGSLTTVHANNALDAFQRIETMVLQGQSNLPLFAIDRQIASALQLVVQLSRMPDGSRKIVEIRALTGKMEGQVISTASLFKYCQDGTDDDGNIVGHFASTGESCPENIVSRINSAGAYFDPEWFQEK
jgi:pilus assembly protein CpaF